MSPLPDLPLSETPAGIPPPGVTPNFNNPQTLVPALIAVNLVMILWTISFVVIRLYVNFHARRGLAIDDYFCIIATVLAFTCTGLVFALSRYARHDYDIPQSWLNGSYRKLSYTVSMVSGPTSFFSKSTILLLYLRIFAIDRTIRYCIWFGLTWTLILYWLAVPLNTVFCIPRYGDSLNLEEQSKPCSNLLIYTLIQGPLGILLDLYIFLLPIPIVLRLQISQKRRLSLLGIFGTAFLGITAAVVGTVYRVKAFRSTTTDWSWAGASLQICIIVENYIAIIVSSMPAFASFFNTTMPGASWLTTLHSLLTKLKHTRNSGRPYPSATAKSSNDVPTTSDSHAPGNDNGYLELHDTKLLRGFGAGEVRTDIQGERAAKRTVEEGVVHKTVVIHQELMPERGFG